jgi:hypothetical protein
VTVRWPNGSSVSYGSFAANRLYQLRQDGRTIVIQP